MAVAYQNAGTASNSAINVTSLTPGKPADTAQYNLLLMVAGIYDSSGVSVTAPSGWTELSNRVLSGQFQSLVYYKIASASEPTSYTLSWTGGRRAFSQVYRFDGNAEDIADVINAWSVLDDSSSDWETYTDDVTSDVDGCLILHIFNWRVTSDGNEGSTPAGLTDIAYNGTGYGAGPGCRLFSIQQASLGLSAGATLSTDDSAFGIGYTIAIAPGAEESPSGPNYPQTASSQSGSGGSTAWVDPSNATMESDTAVAALLDDTPDGSEYLWLTNFGFNLPDGATVDGITYHVNRQSSRSNSVFDLSVRAIVGGAVAGDELADAAAWDNTTETVVYGGSSDTLGLSLDADDINSTGFGFAIAAFSDDEEDAEVNWVTATINWTAGEGGGSTTVERKFPRGFPRGLARGAA